MGKDELRDAGYAVRVWGDELRPRKFQAPKNKSQTVRQAHRPEPGRRANPNDPNSKFETAEIVAGQTKRLPITGPNGMINGGPEYPKCWDTASARVSVIEY